MQIPAPCDYARATSVPDALALLRQHGPEARLIAGGHSLLPMMKLRLARPEWLIDINDLTELAYVRHEGEVLRIGALTRHSAILDSPVVGRLFPILHDAEKVIADPVVRNRGTLGGSLCQADPAEDSTTVCDVLGAEVVIEGPSGRRTIPIAELHQGPYETAVQQDEILLEVRLPVRPRSGSAYQKVERRVGDWAIAAAGAAVSLAADGSIEHVGIGLTAVGVEGVSTRAQDAVRGQQPSDHLYAAAGRLAAEDCDPTSDQRGSADYKRHLAGELTTRALRRACERAAGSTIGATGVGA
ncbi:MAG TPA: xanthine dehydrogenase family protein subunit M [Mycobacteriales bacterium]|jgi:carbon-monoxide dehydrogenase medium subunit|nr:xanthine dehydrogenase family protein subunit M [Mycobacteriales bacterium]